MKYPRKSDIKEHKDRIWTAMLQYAGGYVPIENVSSVIRSLMGDAVLWVHNNHKELDLEDWKDKIASMKLEVLRVET